MRSLKEDREFMEKKIHGWKIHKNEWQYPQLVQGVICPKCGKEMEFTRTRKHIIGPFWEYGVKCKHDNTEGTKIVEFITQFPKDYPDPPREYKLSDRDYKLLEKRLRAFRIWVKKPQPKEAGAFHLNILNTRINDEFHLSVACNGAIEFKVDKRRFYLSKNTKKKIIDIYVKVKGKLHKTWDSDEDGHTMTIQIGGNKIAIDNLYAVYEAGCQRRGTYSDVDGERKSHERSVFCRCGWLSSARKKAIFPEGWE